MQEQISQTWQELQESVSGAQSVAAWSTLAVYLLIGGVLGLYVRFLYRASSASLSNRDSIARVFPLLTMVTISVIAVVKSSLALSLGLVGALSIVRFRAAIKEPEELVYLFLCIGIGLALGSEQPLLAVALVLVYTLFVLVMRFVAGAGPRESLLLTITGDANTHFNDEKTGVIALLDELVVRYELQRLDIEQGRGQVRVLLDQKVGRSASSLVAKLRERLPGCEFSYVNLNSTI